MSRQGHHGSWRASSSGVSLFAAYQEKKLRCKTPVFSQFSSIRERRNCESRGEALRNHQANGTREPEPRRIVRLFYFACIKKIQCIKKIHPHLGSSTCWTVDFLYFLILVSVIDPRKPMRVDANWLEWEVNSQLWGVLRYRHPLPSLDSQRPAVSPTNV